MADFNYLILTEYGQSHSYAAQLVFGALAGFIQPGQIVPTKMHNPDKAARVATQEPAYKLAVLVADDPTSLDRRILDSQIPKVVLTQLPVENTPDIEKLVEEHPEVTFASLVGKPVDAIRTLVTKYYPNILDSKTSYSKK